MPSQVSWPCSIFSGARCFVPHPSELRCPDTQLSPLECWHQPSSFPGPRQGEVTGCASHCCLASPGSCLLPGLPLGTGAWWHSPRTNQGLVVQGLQREGTHEASLAHFCLPSPLGTPQHTHLYLSLLPLPLGVEAQPYQQEPGVPAVPVQLPSGWPLGPL